GCMPLAWLRINGLLGNDMAWISMLAVSDVHQRQGIGSYAIDFSEGFVKEKGFRRLGIHTTDDNIPAQNLYRKCGYKIAGHDECTTDDEIRRMGYTFTKEL
ncbi:MAG: GNAT family N-acetyltransferase, partial [Lachnospiraceae bacterium]|nr:GNAT family N-acetyltransferase [Lachnospiraceae bacterium]